MTLSRLGKYSTLFIFTAFLIGTVSLQAMVASAAATPEGKPGAPAVGNIAPDVELQDLGGNKVVLSKFKGQKPVLLYFWATWCPHCLAARPAVIKLRNAVPKSDLEILAIDVGAGDSLAKVKRFEEAHPAPYTVIYDGEGKAVRAYAVQGIPLFVLIDKAGNVVYRANEMPPDTMKLLRK